MTANDTDFFEIKSIAAGSKETSETLNDLLGGDVDTKLIKILSFDDSASGQEKRNLFFHNAEGTLKRVRRLRTLLEGDITLDQETINEIITALKGTETKVENLRSVLKQIFD